MSLRGLTKTISKRKGEKGFVIIMLGLSLLVLLGGAGLGVDVAILYSVKSKLTAACDGASLAAARNLNLGATMEGIQIKVDFDRSPFVFKNT